MGLFSRKKKTKEELREWYFVVTRPSLAEIASTFPPIPPLNAAIAEQLLQSAREIARYRKQGEEICSYRSLPKKREEKIVEIFEAVADDYGLRFVGLRPMVLLDRNFPIFTKL